MTPVTYEFNGHRCELMMKHNKLEGGVPCSRNLCSCSTCKQPWMILTLPTAVKAYFSFANQILPVSDTFKYVVDQRKQSSKFLGKTSLPKNGNETNEGKPYTKIRKVDVRISLHYLRDNVKPQAASVQPQEKISVGLIHEWAWLDSWEICVTRKTIFSVKFCFN